MDRAEEVARAAFDAFTRRDVAAMVDIATADVELVPAAAGSIDGRCYRGPEGVRDFIRDLDEMWDRFAVVVNEFRAEGDRALMLGRIHARARGSGVEIDQATGAVIEFRNGLVARWQSFLAHEPALTLFRETP